MLRRHRQRLRMSEEPGCWSVTLNKGHHMSLQGASTLQIAGTSADAMNDLQVGPTSNGCVLGQ